MSILLTAKASQVSLTAEGEADNVNYLNSLNGKLIADEFVPDGNQFWGPFSAAGTGITTGNFLIVIPGIAGKGIVVQKLIIWPSVTGQFDMVFDITTFITTRTLGNTGIVIDFSPGVYYWPVDGTELRIYNRNVATAGIGALAIARQFDVP